jgi:hypothetical protein
MQDGCDEKKVEAESSHQGDGFEEVLAMARKKEQAIKTADHAAREQRNQKPVYTRRGGYDRDEYDDEAEGVREQQARG